LEAKSKAHAPSFAETVPRGYLCLHGDDQTMIVRKAEILMT
jgi:hypothetical protein